MQKQNYDSYTLDFIVKASCSYLCESWKKIEHETVMWKDKISMNFWILRRCMN